jgi:hypothetical protein
MGYAARLQADYTTYHHLHADCERTVAEITALVPHTDATFLDTVPGISPLLAARYYTAIGTLKRFPSAGHVWSFAGFDLVQDDSGDRRRVGHITKRGNPHFRDTLFLIGLHTAQQCAPIGTTWLEAQQRGLARVPAILHAAHKANRLCYALLRDRRPYRPVPETELHAFRQRRDAATKVKRRRPPPAR